MQTISDHRVKFGEFAGPLVHGATFFDWQLRSTQELAAAVDYPFETILADDGIPYAPVVVSTSVDRYPAIGDSVSVETVPREVGESSVELVYETVDGDGDPVSTARMTHVTIGTDGSALPLPETAQSALDDACVDRDPAVGPDDAEGDSAADDYPSFSKSVPIRSPHIEGAELAYFEEYPRFADVAMEEFLTEQGTGLAELNDEKRPYKLRDWRWEFQSPVLFESTLTVDCDVVDVTPERIRVAHELSSGGRTNIEGVTEYGCFDRDGNPVAYDDAMLAPFES
ncbi:thioesterase family protein [Halostella salina]|uniref:thioesterase family protein n=1 Tax=Halostella salina TaxID=1547897 RepID=UPI000EF83643|nr:acyl-[acyl-carrier-protein] thioesterase [Halostella salina]